MTRKKSPVKKGNVEKTMPADISALAPFTGFYTMNVAPGAFLSIDSVEQRTRRSDPTSSPLEKTDISISVSMDGKSCTTYAVGDGASFDGATLSIPGQLRIAFSRQYERGRLASFMGTVGGVDVTGETYFNPVPLSAFAGDYYDVQTTERVLSIADDLAILFDFGIFLGTPEQLREVQNYDYLPAMFVLEFSDERHAPPNTFTLMLGTAGKRGLACSIQGGGTPRLAVSIL
jgi:hypothetical protein